MSNLKIEKVFLISSLLDEIAQLYKHTGFRLYFSNVSWLFGEKVFRMLVGLFVGVWVARYLGPDKFGTLSYAQAFVGLFATISTLGLDSIVVRELVKDESKRDVLLGTAFILRLMGGFAALSFLAVAIYFTSNDQYTNILIFIISASVIFQSFNVIEFYFRSKVLSRYIVYVNVISLFLSSVIKILMILFEAPLIAFVCMVVFDSVILAIGLVYIYSRNNHSLKKWEFNKLKAAEILKESWPLLLSGMASMINMRMDQVLLGNMATKIVVGNYAVAVKISELWFLLPAIIGSTVYPAIISAKEHSMELYKKRIFQTVKYMSLFAIPFAFFVSITSHWIINILYGEKYLEAGTFLSLHIWTGVPYVMFFILGQVFLIEKLTKLSLYVTILIVIFNILLNYLLIPKYGGIGSALASLIVAYGAQFISIVIIYRKTQIFSKSAI